MPVISAQEEDMHFTRRGSNLVQFCFVCRAWHFCTGGGHVLYQEGVLTSPFLLLCRSTEEKMYAQRVELCCNLISPLPPCVHPTVRDLL